MLCISGLLFLKQVFLTTVDVSWCDSEVDPSKPSVPKQGPSRVPDGIELWTRTNRPHGPKGPPVTQKKRREGWTLTRCGPTRQNLPKYKNTVQGAQSAHESHILHKWSEHFKLRRAVCKFLSRVLNHKKSPEILKMVKYRHKTIRELGRYNGCDVG